MKVTDFKEIDEIKNYLDNFDYDKFYGKYTFDGKEYVASNLLFSLMISKYLDIDFVYYEKIDNSILNKILNNKLISNYSDDKLKENTIKLINEILNITDKIVRMNGITFSYHEFLTNKVNLNDIKESLHEKLDDNMRKSLVIVDEAEKETLKRLREAKSPIMKLVDSGARGNQKQLGQEFLAIGYKVDNHSNILPNPIMSSFIDGMNEEEDFYVASIGARNAIIQGTNYVAKSGYLNRKLCFGTIDIVLSNENDCGTTNYLEVLVTKENYDYMLNGRYIFKDGKNILVDVDTAKTLIGEVVKLRSPTKCKCKDGICKTCYGVLSLLNKNLSIGIIAATSIAEIITQSLLSTKHLLYASIFGDNPFIMNLIDIDHENDIIMAKEDIIIDITHTGKIFITSGKEKELFKHNFKSLIINNNGEDVLLSDITTDVTFTFKSGDKIFSNIKHYTNSDMNSLLNVINRIFEKRTFMNEINNIDLYFTYMIDLQNNISKIPSVHMEIILSQMTKVKNEHSKLWRMNQDKEPEIISIGKSNLSNDLFNNILFERVKGSLLDINNYIVKDKPKTKYSILFNS